jgi:hypothetical protein
VLAAVLVLAGSVAPVAQATPAQSPGLDATVTPSTALTDGAEVTISVTGLQGDDDWVTAWQCPADATNPGDCDRSDAAQEFNEGGRAELRFRVDAVITAGPDDREVDCREADACILGLARPLDDLTTLPARVPLHFTADAPTAPPPTLAIRPDDDLVDGQQVHVEGSGFVWAYQDVTVVQCTSDVSSWEDCDSDTYIPAPLEGTSFELDVRVSSQIVTAAGVVDCRVAGACALVAPMDYRYLPRKTGVASLHFDPRGPLPEPTALTISPDHDLVDGQQVTLRATGFGSDALLHLFHCGGEPSWETCRYLDGHQAGADGGLTLDMRVFATVDAGQGEVDCRTTTCWLVVATDGVPDSPRAARSALAFDPDAPLRPPGNVSVVPATGLTDGDTITVEGDNWLPGSAMYVAVCDVDQPDICDEQASAEPTTDDSGRWTTELVVASSFTFQGDIGVSCTQPPGCAVVALDTLSGRSTAVPLLFGPPGHCRSRWFDRRYRDGHAHRARHQGLDLGGGPAVPRVRLRVVGVPTGAGR